MRESCLKTVVPNSKWVCTTEEVIILICGEVAPLEKWTECGFKRDSDSMCYVSGSTAKFILFFFNRFSSCSFSSARRRLFWNQVVVATPCAMLALPLGRPFLLLLLFPFPLSSRLHIHFVSHIQQEPMTGTAVRTLGEWGVMASTGAGAVDGAGEALRCAAMEVGAMALGAQVLITVAFVLICMLWRRRGERQMRSNAVSAKWRRMVLQVNASRIADSISSLKHAFRKQPKGAAKAKPTARVKDKGSDVCAHTMYQSAANAVGRNVRCAKCLRNVWLSDA